jgi:carbamoyltransferase
MELIMKYQFAENKWITDELEVVIEKLTGADNTPEKCVGLFQGTSEIGPRALGNRSLLFNPLNPYAKNIMNNIKQREHYRPFAGSIMLEHADTWFDMCGLKDSPWMTYAIPAKQLAKETIPAIIHVDGSCRIQTVTEEQNEHYYNLIKSFHELMLERGEEGDAEYGCPIIFNTSFNLKGAAIVETLDDAMDTCVEGGINILYVPAWEDDGLTLPDEWIEPEETDDDVKDSVKLKTLPTHLTK